MPSVGGFVPEVKLSPWSIRRDLTKQTMVGGNHASPNSRGESVNCCGGKCTVAALTVWPTPSPAPSDARPHAPRPLPLLYESADL